MKIQLLAPLVTWKWFVYIQLLATSVIEINMLYSYYHGIHVNFKYCQNRIITRDSQQLVCYDHLGDIFRTFLTKF
jgi:hypothetical protein